MEEVTVAQAKAHLSELIERAERGEPVRITRRGKLVARLTGAQRRVKPVDLRRVARFDRVSTWSGGADAKLAKGRAGRRTLLMLYVDTSVIVSVLTNEADTALSQIWLARQEPSELTISDWTATEFAFRAVDKIAVRRSWRRSSRGCASQPSPASAPKAFAPSSVAREDFRAAARFADQSELSIFAASDALHLGDLRQSWSLALHA